METKHFNQDFAAKFQTASIQELVEIFNHSVGSRGWTSMRAVHDQMLISEIIRRRIDVFAIHKGNTTDYTHKVVYDESLRKLLIATE